MISMISNSQCYTSKNIILCFINQFLFMANVKLREKIQSLRDASTRNLEEQSKDLEDVICNIFSCSPRRPYNVNIRYKVQKEVARYSGQHCSICMYSSSK